MHIDNLIYNFSSKNLVQYLRSKISTFKPDEEDLIHLFEDEVFEKYETIEKIGEAKLSGDELLVILSKTTDSLTEKSGKKNQYEIAKKILKEEGKDASIFVFYDDEGNFRFSLVNANYLGTKRNYSDFKRYTYFVDKTKSNKTFIKQVGECNFNSLDEIIKAFSVEPLNKLFYQEVSKAFYELIGGKISVASKKYDFTAVLELPSTPLANRKIYQEFSVRLIGRMIFCWFLKNKKSPNQLPLIPENWLQSDTVELLNNGGFNYYHDYLEKLFFLILNKKQDERTIYDLPDGHDIIPFLNGGLFEPHVDDFFPRDGNGIHRVSHNLRIPNEWFFKFFQVLEQFNFTIDENSINDAEVSIDPEMLGTIFENLLAEIDPDTEKSARKSTGSFYTPREIVDYMVEQSINQYLKTKTSIVNDISLQNLYKEGGVNEFNGEQTIEILEALNTVKILDPACGSGAFPMGALHKIITILHKLDPDASWWKEKQIENISNAVVKKLMREKLDTSSADYIRKLGVIQNSIYGVDIQPIATEISKLRSFLSLVIDENIFDDVENRGIEPLPNLEFKFVTANTLIGLPEEGGQQSLYENYEELQLLEQLRGDYLQSSGKKKTDIKERFSKVQRKAFSGQNNLFADHESRSFKLMSWNPFGDEASTWFDSQWMFGIDKFDIVMGNPPYVDIKALPKKDVKEYFKTYKTAQNRINLYSIFIEKGKLLLKDLGVLCYINPNSILINDSYEKIREFIINDVERIIKLPDSVFLSASVETIILMLSININNEIVKGAYFSNKDKINFHDLNFNSFDRAIWINDSKMRFNIFSSNVEKSVLEKIENNSIYLEEFVHTSLGITPYDKYKGHSAELINGREYHSEIKLSSEYVPLIGGKSIHKYYISNEIKEYLKYGNWLGAARDEKFFTNPKIIVRQIVGGKELNIVATYSEESVYFTQIGFSLISKNNNPEELKYFSGLLNSKLMSFYHKNKFLDIEKNLFQKILIANCKKLPVKNISKEKQKPFVSIINQISKLKAKEEESITQENHLDILVYKLYELDYHEVLIIDSKFNLSPDEYVNYNIE